MTTRRSTLPTLNQRLSPLSTTSFRDAVLYTTECVVVLGIDFGYLLLVFTNIVLSRVNLSEIAFMV